MNIRFSPDAARREMTPVDNLFFLHYMPEADGTFVKVYLYGLMQCYHRSLTEVQIGEALGLSDAQVRCAFVYWQAKGLVRILGDEPFSVEYLLTEQPALQGTTPQKYRRLIDSVHALLAPRTLELRELKAIYDCIELYGLEEGAVLALVAYCIEQKGKRVSTNYVLSVAQTWNEQDIRTQTQAEEYVADYRMQKHGAAEVLRRWNLRRPPTRDEMALYDRWINELGFDAEAILAACARMTNTAQPTFAKLDERLNEWKEQNIENVPELLESEQQDALDSEFAKLVYARLGKIGKPDKTTVRQLRMFREEKGIDREAILMAADECTNAERPLGLLKRMLADWADAGVHTVRDAEKALVRTKPVPQKKKKNAALLYEQTPISEQDFNNLIVDLNEDV
ncbi:MAG: DnaD domain protein [Clostridia bacterium]|nr:DnaD domain protein [Clostridia bacterium]MBR3130620.1 DnaD domain protein [Clostridia bacterium]